MSNPPSSVSETDDHSGEFDADERTAEAVRTLADGTRDALTATETFDSNDLFEVLADPGRRYVLTYLLQSTGAVSCSDLVDYVVDRADHTMTRETFRERVVRELTDTHLPALDEYGFVQYSMERQMVAPTDLTPIARPYLRLALAQEEIATDEATTAAQE